MNIQIKINDSSRAVGQYQVESGAGAKGKALHIDLRGQKNLNVELINEQTGTGPENIAVKRVGKDLHVAFEQSDIANPDVIVEGYYDDQNDHGLIARAEDGLYYYYIPESGASAQALSNLSPNVLTGQALGGESYPTALWPANGGVSPLALIGGALLIGAAAGGGGGGGSDAPPPPPPPPPPPAPGNHAPTIGSYNETTAEDIPLTGRVQGSDEDGDTLTYGKGSDPSHGKVTVNPDGSYTYTPDKDYNGPDSFTVAVSDGHGGTTTSTVTIDVMPVNDAPMVGDYNKTTPENTPVSGLVAGTDVDGDALTYGKGSDPSHGTVVVHPDGSYTYTPNTSWTGTDTFTVTVDDGHGGTTTSTVRVNVTPPPTPGNTSPVVSDYSKTTPEDTPVSGQVTGSDVDGDTLTYNKGSDPSHGTVIVNSNGSYTYTPNADWNGSDSFTVTVSDGKGGVTTSTVTVAVTPEQDAFNDSASTSSGQSVNIAVLGNDTFEGASPAVSVAAGDGPAHGTAVVNADGSITYTAAAGYTGSDSFTYTVTSGGVTETATVTVTVGANGTTIVGATSGSGSEDSGAITGTITASDLDGLSSTTPYAVSSNGTHGTATVDSTGHWSYTPNADWNGNDSFVITVTDALGHTSTQTVNVTVTPVADIADDTASTTSGQSVNIAVLGNDSFEGTPVVTAVGTAGHGTVSINGDGTVKYTANAGYEGPDTFTYTVTSGGVTETATVTVTVGANGTTIVGATSGSGSEDGGAITGQITASDLDGLGATPYAVSSNGTHGTATVDSTGHWSYTPNADYNGSDSFVITVTDALGHTSTQTVNVTVTPVVDIAPDTANTTSGQSVNIAVLDNDTFEGASPVVSVAAGDGPTHGTTVVNADGSITYTAAAGYTGPDTFTYTVTSGGVTETATVTVTVGANGTTIVGATSGSGSEDGGAITGQITASDLDGLGATPYAVSSNGTHGTASVDSSGHWSYTPNADWNGNDSFVITVTDALGHTSTQTVNVTVTPVVDIADDTANTTSGQAVNIAVLGNDTFEGASPAVSVAAGDGPAHGTAVVNADGSITYTAAAGYTGPDSFTYTVTSGGVTETATVTVTVGANGTTINGDKSGSGSEDGAAITGTITAMDLDGLDATTPYAVSGNGTHGTATVDSTGHWSYTPNADYNGNDSFVITVTDALGHTSTQTVNVTVTPVVDIADDTANTTSGQAVNIAVLGNDTFEGTPVVTAVGTAGHGTVSINGDGTVKYTANAGYEGQDTFTYTVTSGGVTETATVTVTVGANGTTINGDKSGSGAEDGGSITGTVTAMDLDGLDATTPYAISSNGTHGTATVDSTGHWSYTPNADWNGSDSFVITVTDALGHTSTQTVNVTVTPVVDIADDTASTTSGQSVNIAVLGNDSFEGTPVVTAVGTAGHGTVSINGDGTVKYTANAGYEGPDTFTYTVTSGGVTETATVTVTVGANGTTITGQTAGSGAEDGAAITGTITASDLDGLSSTTPYAVSSNGTHGTASVDSSGHWSYTPNADWNGNDSFVITVTDALGHTSTQTVSVTVTPVVDIAPDTANTTSGQSVNIAVLGNDTFEGASPVVSVEAGDGPAHGTVSINPDGSIKYTATAGYIGPDSFTYTVTSGGVTETATVTVTVGANGTTINGDKSGSGSEDGAAITGTITAMDLDGLDATTPYAVSSNGTHGTATVDSTGHWSYTPNADWNGSDSFVITVTDALGHTSTQTVNVTVTPVVDIADDTASTTSGQSVNIAVLDNDTFEGASPAVSVAAGDGPTHGTTVVNADGSITYTAAAGYTGPDTFTYTVTSGGVTEMATVTVTVGANGTTITGQTTGSGAEDGAAITGTITAIDLDGLDATTPYAVSGNGTHGTATVDSTGHWSYTPNADYNGSDSFVITVTDALGHTSTQTVNVTVTPVVDIADDTASTTSGQSVDVAVLGNDTFEGTPVVTAVGTAGHGTVSINGDGTVKYTANAGYEGPDTFTYTVTSGGVTETATVTVTVGANGTTINGDKSGSGAEDGGSITGTVTAMDLDGLDATTPYAVSSNGTHGTATVDSTGHWSYTPNADYNGNDSFVITVTDALGHTSTQTVNVTVTPVVDIADDTANTTSGQAVNIAVLGNDTFEGTPVVTAVGTAGHGTVSINGDGTVKYTANAGYEGQDTFTYTVTSGGVTETATVTVTVGANGTTINGDKSGSGAEDGGSITGTVTAIDLDGLDATTPYAVSSNGTHGTASVDSTGHWSYTPNADYNGNDSFVITVTDALGHTSTQTVNVTVTPVVDIAPDTANTTSGQSVNIAVLGNDTFEGASPAVSVAAGDGPAHGTAVVNADGSITYTAAAGYTGSDTFTYTVTSGGVTETATVTVTVGANGTTIVGATSGSGSEDGAAITGTITASDLDGLDATTPYAVSGNGTHGTASVDSTGHWSYTPNADWNGNDSFVITVTDALGHTSTQTVNVTVTPVVDIADDTANTTSGQSVNIAVLDNDTFEGASPAVSVAAGDGPAHGTVSINPDGSITYTAAAGYTGPDSFTYTVTSGGVTETATVTVTVGANGTTINGDKSGSGAEDGGSITGTITAIDLDGLDATTPYAVSGNGTHGTATVDSSGHWSYTPNADWNGNDSFVITVTDALGHTSTQTVNVTVTPVVDIADDTANTTSGQSVNIAVLGNDTFEGTPVVTAVGTAGHGTVSINGDGTVKYTANAGYEGQDTFTYTVTSGGVTETATVTVTVGAPVPQVPTDVQITSTRVSEEGLPGGLPDSLPNLTDDTTNSASSTGTITFTDTDSSAGDLSVTLSGPANITSGGTAVTWSWDVATHTLTGSAGSTPVMTIAVGGVTDTGGGSYSASYTATLLGPVDHPTGGNPGVEDVLTMGFSATVSDGVNTSTSANFSIAVEDDSPRVVDATVSASVGQVNTNLMVILDISGSMDDGSGVTGKSRLQLAKEAIYNLIDGYDQYGEVRVQVVTFSSSGAAQATWLTANQAKILIEGLTAGGGTNYDAALSAATSGFAATGKLTNGQNVSYFLTDGDPSTTSNGINSTEEATWTSFLSSNHINSFALGMGTGLGSSAQTNINPIAYNGVTSTNTNGVLVTDMSQLDGVLQNTVQVPAKVSNLLTGDLSSSNLGYGADGGSVSKVTLDGTTYSYNHVTGALSITGTNRSTFDSATHTATITTLHGGTLVLNFATGGYEYQPSSTLSNYSETLGYTVVDRDGDEASATQTLNVTHVGSPQDDIIYTDATSASIPISALLGNDAVPNAVSITLSGASSNLAVSQSGGMVTFTFNSGSTGSFQYTVTNGDGNTSDIATVNIVWQSGSTVTGTSGQEILLGRDGADDTINSGGGADIIYGGTGNDTITGVTQDVALIDGGGGTSDTLSLAASFTSTGDGQIVNVERVTLTQSGTTLNLSNQTEGFTITGSTGADTILGGSGADKISAGRGNDILTGGTGADQFIFNTALNSGNNVDTITDFSSADGDKIVLSRAGIFNSLPTSLTASELVVVNTGGTSGISGSNAHLIYETSTGNLYYDSNGAQNASQRTLFATLGTTTHPTTLTINDFMLI